LREVYVLHFHLGYLNTPWLGVVVKDDLRRGVYLFAFGEDFVELKLAHNVADRRLRFLRCGVEVVLHLRKREVRVHHAEIAHRVYFDGNVIARDDVLRGHVKSFDAQRDAIESLDRPENQAQPGRLGVGQHASETQHDSTLPLLADEDRAPEPDL